VAIVKGSARKSASSNHPPYRLEYGGTSVGLKVGEKMSLYNLLVALLLCSGNDAANVLAEHVSGSVPLFMEELSLYLRNKGIKESLFLNPHGLHTENHMTTAYEMAQISRLAMNFPVFREIVAKVKHNKPETNKQPEAIYVQHNRLLKKGPYFYPKAIGVKTGYTSTSGYTLVAAAEHEGRTLLAVLLGASDMGARYRDVTNLFEAAFSEEKTERNLFANRSDRFTKEIEGASCLLDAQLLDNVKIAYFPSEEPHCHAHVKWKSVS
ncbi:unnamed protein product, partial [marine sediment metagenome]